MGLNITKGNMYEGFITHTWNVIKGVCPHHCSYCYVKRWGQQPELHFDEKELRTDLGVGNIIFVGSGCDMWADLIPENWIIDVLDRCAGYKNNKYFFQTKNSRRFKEFKNLIPPGSTLCVTMESDLWYKEIMGDSPMPAFRMDEFSELKPFQKMVTIEPILVFNLQLFVAMLHWCQPIQINIGADSGRNNLPEPSKDNILELIAELGKITKVVQKKNLARLLK
jgi:hypothetical protein